MHPDVARMSIGDPRERDVIVDRLEKPQNFNRDDQPIRYATACGTTGLFPLTSNKTLASSQQRVHLTRYRKTQLAVACGRRVDPVDALSRWHVPPALDAPAIEVMSGLRPEVQ